MRPASLEALEARLNALGVPHERIACPHFGAGVAVSGHAVHVWGRYYNFRRSFPTTDSAYTSDLDEVIARVFLRPRGRRPGDPASPPRNAPPR